MPASTLKAYICSRNQGELLKPKDVHKNLYSVSRGNGPGGKDRKYLSAGRSLRKKTLYMVSEISGRGGGGGGSGGVWRGRGGLGGSGGPIQAGQDRSAHGRPN